MTAGMRDPFDMFALNMIFHIRFLFSFDFATNIAGILSLSKAAHHRVYGFIKFLIIFTCFQSSFCQDHGCFLIAKIKSLTVQLADFFRSVTFILGFLSVLVSFVHDFVWFDYGRFLHWLLLVCIISI